MRILGIDYGDRRIGLAVSDRLGLTAQPLGMYETVSEERDKRYFSRLKQEYEIERIVLGLPLRMNGTSGPRVDKTRAFARWLQEFLDIPIVFWDERLTTKQAMDILMQQKIRGKAKKEVKDQVSAVIILSSYLESLRARVRDEKNP